MWSIGLNIGEAFAEIVAQGGENSVERRWNLFSTPLLSGIQNFLKDHDITEIQSIKVSTSLSLYFQEKELGSPAAFLVSQGFEEWLALNSPVTFDSATGYSRSLPYLNSDLIFPIQERISASGEVVTPLSLSTIEPILARLQLLDISTVVIGLLHSTTNPEHEVLLRDYIEQAGFRVIISSDQTKHTESLHNEKDRWHQSLFEAYLKAAFEEHFAKFTTSDLYLDWNSRNLIQFVDRDLYGHTWNELPLLGSFWAEAQQLQQFSQDGGTIHLGLERWYGHFPHLGRKWAQCKKLPSHGDLVLLPIQPTQSLSHDHWGLISTVGKSMGFLPGPISFGRGHTLTPLDLFFLRGYLDPIDGIEIKNPRKAHLKATEALNLLTQKHNKKRNETQTLAQEALISLFFTIEPLWTSKNQFKLVGPLAPAVYSLFQNLPIQSQLSVVPNSTFWTTDKLAKNKFKELHE